MLRRPDIDHILRAAASLSGHSRFVKVGTGAVIATAKHIPLAMMMTEEIDIYVEGVPDRDWISDLIDAAIGRDSQFHRTFGYYGDGVSERTAVMPLDWRRRATEYTTPDGLATAVCPSAEDIAIAKLCAWRDKDQAWLREAFRSGIAKAQITANLLAGELPDAAPARSELSRRISLTATTPRSPPCARQSATTPASVNHRMIDDQMPVTGAVLGIDVGFSKTRRSSAVCRLDWDSNHIRWTMQRFRALPAEQESSIATLAGSIPLEAAAFDGPLRTGLDIIGSYRVADRMLTRRVGSRIGKPGQTNAPVGKELNAAANNLAKLVLRLCQLKPARHATGIDDMAIAEAFPNSFLGVMLENPSLVPARRDDRSDKFFEHLASDGTLRRLSDHLLPGRAPSVPFESVSNHDDRAALICALTALAVAAGDFTAVGDSNGWIILPPRRFVRDWAWHDLEMNAQAERRGCLHRSEPAR
jgi:hypothetical protein